MLTPRLKCIVDSVEGDIVADIGTDHAYVSVELIRSGRAKKVIASDVRKGPLNIAKDNIKKYELCDKIETRLGSGLSVLNKNEADIIIIAGMGGELICDIIKNDIDTARMAKLILQPMNAQYELRKFLINNGFTIDSEKIETEGNRVYNFLIVINGKQIPFSDDIEYHLPKYLYNNSKFSELLNKKKREFNKIINGLSKSKNCDNMKLDYYKNSLIKLEEIENESK